MQDLRMHRIAARRWRSWKVTKRDFMVASTRHHRARLLKYYPRPPCAPSFVKTRMLRPLQTHFLLFQQIFFILVCIHVGNPRVPPRVVASGPKPCGGSNYKGTTFSFLQEESFVLIEKLLGIPPKLSNTVPIF